MLLKHFRYTEFVYFWMENEIHAVRRSNNAVYFCTFYQDLTKSRLRPSLDFQWRSRTNFSPRFCTPKYSKALEILISTFKCVDACWLLKSLEPPIGKVLYFTHECNQLLITSIWLSRRAVSILSCSCIFSTNNFR